MKHIIVHGTFEHDKKRWVLFCTVPFMQFLDQVPHVLHHSQEYLKARKDIIRITSIQEIQLGTVGKANQKSYGICYMQISRQGQKQINHLKLILSHSILAKLYEWRAINRPGELPGNIVAHSTAINDVKNKLVSKIYMIQTINYSLENTDLS